MNYALRSVAGLFAFIFFGSASAQDAAIDQGRTLRIDGNIDQSIQTLKEVVAKDPSNFRGLYNLAMALAESPQKDAAAGDFAKAIELGEEQGMPDPTIYNSYGWYLTQQGKFAEAQLQYDKGMKYFDKLPDDSKQRLLNNIGLLYLQTGQIDKAEAQFAQTADKSAGAERSLAIIRTIKMSSSKSLSSGLTGLLYLGQTDEGGNKWISGSAITSATAPTAVHVNDELTLHQAANVHSESTAEGNASVAGPSTGVLNVGSVVKVLDVRRSPVQGGGDYVWAKVQETAGGGIDSH